MECLGIGKGKILANVLTTNSIIHFSNLCSVLEPDSEQIALCVLLQKNTTFLNKCNLFSFAQAQI